VLWSSQKDTTERFATCHPRFLNDTRIGQRRPSCPRRELPFCSIRWWRGVRFRSEDLEETK